MEIDRKIELEEWLALIKEQAESGLSRKDFCQKKGLVLSRFAYYFIKLKKKEIKKPVDFANVMPIHLKKELPNTFKSEAKITFPNGLCLYVSCGENTRLKTLIEVLKSC